MKHGFLFVNLAFTRFQRLVLLCMLASFGCVAQGYEPSKVIPPTPTASSLGLYGNTSVGYFTGKPNVTIPLHDIKTANHALSIALNYDATAIRTGQEASWVGLNWTMAAGGVITRTVRNMDDFDPNGYYNAPPLRTQVTDDNFAYFTEVASGRVDVEPDMFTFSTPSFSGKFLLGKKAAGSIVYLDNLRDIKIETFDGVSWMITDENGYKYYFATREQTRDDYVYSAESSLQEDPPLSSFTYSEMPGITTSWYLDSIVSPTNEAITFRYESTTQSLSSIQRSEKQVDLISVSGNCSAAGPRFANVGARYSASRQITSDVYLTTIEFNNGSVEFERSDRLDLDYFGTEIPDKLSGLIIKDADGKMQRKYVFNYAYFYDGGNGRLKLESLLEYDQNGNVKPPYIFQYFANNLPSKDTKRIDHWGFFNDKDNTVLFPDLLVRITEVDYRYLSGAMREGTENIDLLTKGVLSSITYPTGGITEFEYEPNTYNNPHGDDAFRYEIGRKMAETLPGDLSRWTVDLPLFTETTNVELVADYEPYTNNPTNFFAIETIYANLVQGTTTLASLSNWDCPGETDPTCGDTKSVTHITLPPGQYSITVDYREGWRTTLRATYKLKTAVTKKTGGGIRVKTITNKEHNKTATVRSFIYTLDGTLEGTTSGKLFTPPAYSYQFEAVDVVNEACTAYVGHFTCRTSSSVYAPGLTSAGAIVGYDVVTEVFGANGMGGRNEYAYLSYEDQGGQFPYMPSYSSPYNGKLKYTTFKNSTGVELKKVEYEYEQKAEIGLKGVKLYQENLGGFPSGYEIRVFEDFGHWVVQKSESETLNPETNPIFSKQLFFYDGATHKMLTERHEFKSDGRRWVTRYRYVGDLHGSSTSFPAQMKTLNIVAPVIEEQNLVWDNGVLKLRSGTFTEYAKFNSKFYKPSTIRSIETRVPFGDVSFSDLSGEALVLHSGYATQVTFDRYDAIGNLEMYHKENNVNQGYLWDYKATLPIAQVSNASFNDVGYTSFESDGKGGWQWAGAITSADEPQLFAATGKRFYVLSATTAMSKDGLVSGREYVVSYWSQNGAYTISGADVLGTTTGASVNGWTFYEQRIKTTATVIGIGGSGAIDEVRLFPLSAQLSTYTYTPQQGISTISDPNGKVIFYEWDGLNRLRCIRDHNGNVINRYDYHYATPQN